MLRRRALTLAAAAASLLAAACTDDSPTLQGDDFFPSGRPTTLQVFLPADSFFTLQGDFSGYPASALSPVFSVIAEDYQGVLDSHVLLRPIAPEVLEYVQGSVTRRDTIRAFTAGRLTVPIDSAASAVGGPVTFQLWELAQSFDPGSVSWTLARDSAGVRTPWTQPGGTRGALLSQSVWTPSEAGDSIRFALDSATVNRVAAAGFPGLLVTSTAGSRVQTGTFTLRAGARPRLAGGATDTLITVPFDASAPRGPQIYIFSPDQPRSATALEVGGVRSARTLFRLDLDRTVPGCPAGNASCARVPLRDVRLNEVALLFRPVPTPGGFEPRDSTFLELFNVLEPELGARAPLGTRVPGSQTAYAPGDSLVAIPVTTYALIGIARDTLAGDIALVSTPEASTFGVLWLESAPRLRITYTLPVAPRFP